MSKRIRGKGPDIASLLLAWYDRSRRELPWRYAPGVVADPYRVWLSEIMLQQTVVKAVIPYFLKFTAQWPDVTALAAAPLDDVLAAWAGLGYYSRARNLHACAVTIASRHAGRFPAEEPELLALPGVGPYTAAAIRAIGHGLKATPVDGNIERVVARLFAIDAPLPAAKKILKQHAQTLTPEQRAGDFAQAMMDLGATVCAPRSPSCLVCPLREPCRARAKGNAYSLPVRAAKTVRPVRYGTAYVVVRADGAVLLRRRANKGLLGGMMEVPSSDWIADRDAEDSRHEPVMASWHTLNAPIVHVFTHFRLELTVKRATVGVEAEPLSAADPTRCSWIAEPTIWSLALPTLMRKVLVAALVPP